MKYYCFKSCLTDDVDNRETSVLDFPSWVNEKWSPPVGRPILGWDEQVFAYYQHEAPHVDFPCVLGEWDIMSEGLRQIIEGHAPGEMQFLGIRIRSVFGDGPITGYYVAHYLRWIDCIDRQCSRAVDDNWEPYNQFGDIDLEHIVISKMRIADARIFRVRGDSYTTVMREDLVNAIKAAQLTGIVFEALQVSP